MSVKWGQLHGLAFTLLLVHALQERLKYLPVNDGIESLQ